MVCPEARRQNLAFLSTQRNGDIPLYWHTGTELTTVVAGAWIAVSGSARALSAPGDCNPRPRNRNLPSPSPFARNRGMSPLRVDAERVLEQDADEHGQPDVVVVEEGLEAGFRLAIADQPLLVDEEHRGAHQAHVV